MLEERSLLATKTIVPPRRSLLLPRAHLFTMLDQSCSVPLTLLSASAGFGKTTLLSAWASRSTGHVAWLSLDGQDNDPTRFWAYVIAALRKVDISLGEAAQALLHSSQPALLTSALTSLINQLALLGQETVLILDDYHLISEPAIHASLQFLLDHLPACLHLLLASRILAFHLLFPFPHQQQEERASLAHLQLNLRTHGINWMLQKARPRSRLPGQHPCSTWTFSWWPMRFWCVA